MAGDVLLLQLPVKGVSAHHDDDDAAAGAAAAAAG